MVKEELAFAHQATCGPDPPVESRHEVLFTGLTVYAVFVLATAVLMWRGRTLGLIFAMILAIFAIGYGIVSLIALPIGISTGVRFFWDFVLIAVVIGVLAYVGRRRQKKMQAERAEQIAARTR